jgi:hypothetical protein
MPDAALIILCVIVMALGLSGAGLIIASLWNPSLFLIVVAAGVSGAALFTQVKR